MEFNQQKIMQFIHQLNTIQDIVRFSNTLLSKENLFYGHGYLNAKQEAIQTCMHALGLNYDDYSDFMQATLLEHEKLAIIDIIEKRCNTKKPLAYLINKAPFHGLNFYIDERVIVPRSFIGELILDDTLITIMQDNNLDYNPDNNNKTYNILDLCTGSGCLAILAQQVFNAKVDAIDISKPALEVAQINVDKYKLQDKITLIHSDTYDSLDNNYHNKYDLIISNPPYVNALSMKNLPNEYQREPELALSGGLDGMDIVRKIIAQAKNFLQPDGLLVIEIGNEYHNVINSFNHLALNWLPVSAGESQVFCINAQDL